MYNNFEVAIYLKKTEHLCILYTFETRQHSRTESKHEPYEQQHQQQKNYKIILCLLWLAVCVRLYMSASSLYVFKVAATDSAAAAAVGYS